MEAGTLRDYLALLHIPGVGSFTARQLIAYCGSAKDALQAKRDTLLRIPHVEPNLAESIVAADPYRAADAELEYIARHRIQVMCATEDDYPSRLKGCPDAPLLLFYRSDRPFPVSEGKRISIVGTRRATAYGREFVQRLVAGLARMGHQPVVVSGLAHGIDGEAHRAALEHGCTTIGVLGHGLGHFYPAGHRELGRRMVSQGGLLSEYPSTLEADRSTFVQRNRIVAGLSEATVVVESDLTGGAMITAHRALEYGREVLALPGRARHDMNAGCNWLIKKHKAALIEEAEDLAEALGWDSLRRGAMEPVSLFYTPNEAEQAVIDIVREHAPIAIDELIRLAKAPINTLNAMLLNLEFHGLLRQLPGRCYEALR